jgi:2-oxoglutarate dehydrogenase E1 component
MHLPETLNAQFIDSQYRLWQSDPQALPKDWRYFFEGFQWAQTAGAPAPADDGEPYLRQARVEALIYRYRSIGHLMACMDPLAACPTDHPYLNLEALDLTGADLEREFVSPQLSSLEPVALKAIIAMLRETYCRSIGVEFMHLQDPEERQWLIDRMETPRNHPKLSDQERRRMLTKLIDAHEFERFLHKRYVAQTRFSLEGADALIPMLDLLIQRAAGHGTREIILGMAHRGRLNVLTHILQKSYEEIFSEFESCYDPASLIGAGDVKYHNGYMAEAQTDEGHTVSIFMVNNPSHLEAVDPVVEGIARARQDLRTSDAERQVLPLIIHGDAAFAGQGVVFETLNMSQLEGYRTGGTVHIIINNQIGYTTLPQDARSTRYSTDVAKMLMVPIFHVHGENPEAVAQVIQLAHDYRREFAKDVVIDLVCYRRYGHNEGDEPYFTQPLMYDRIRERPSLFQLYQQQLNDDGLAVDALVKDREAATQAKLEDAMQAVLDNTCPLPTERFFDEWDGYHGNYSFAPAKTAVTDKGLLALARSLNQVPEGFNLNVKIKRLLQRRLEAVTQGEQIDWANAEALAFGSLLLEGDPVRLSGQDCGRGTFSHRHSVLFDTQSGNTHMPLNHLDPRQAPFRVFNSLLSEVGVLGFEYGYALTDPRGLVIWEAQFGDFANNAQTVVDLFIASGETKWQRYNGLVMLLPHGWEGLGPEHSSARLERFLQLCAQNNMQVCNLSTPAQYFHLLRHQAKQTFRKPLILMAPKSLLRHPLAVSKREELTSGHFQPVLIDDAPLNKVKKVLVCSGKIYYELAQRRRELEALDTAIVRVEQFYPFPREALQAALAPFEKAKQWFWVQEGPRNMEAWHFMQPRLHELTGKAFAYIGREASPSPATGFPVLYRQQQAAIIDEAVGALAGKDGQPAVS